MMPRRRLIHAAIALFILVAADPSPAARSDAGARPRENSLAGQLLVATPSLKSGVFHRTVIFLLRHDSDGAFGLILNRPLEKRSLKEMMRNFAVEGPEPPERDITVHFGGPVQRGLAIVLHSTEFAGPDTLQITGGLAAATAPKAVLRAMAEGKGPKQTMFAAGYAGWGPGQLESEIDRGSWAITPADRQFLFDTSFSTMWRRALKRRVIDL
jgi:putative transcriptional regulator